MSNNYYWLFNDRLYRYLLLIDYLLMEPRVNESMQFEEEDLDNASPGTPP